MCDFIFAVIADCKLRIMHEGQRQHLIACIRETEDMEFFEGTEKLMEVWWAPVLGDDGAFADLRTISR